MPARYTLLRDTEKSTMPYEDKRFPYAKLAWLTRPSRCDVICATLRKNLACILVMLMCAGAGWTSCKYSQSAISAQPKDAVSRILSALYSPIKVSVTQDAYLAPNGQYYVTTQPHWREPLEEQVLILDVDTRSMDNETQLLYDGSCSWEKMESRAAGLLNHYMYSHIHNYDYKFIRAEPLPDLYPTWVKVKAIKDALKKYRVVVFMDADALWNTPEVPLEWLMNHWEISSTSSFAFSGDWAHGVNGPAAVNTGFTIAVQGDRTNEILDAWMACPTGEQFPGCEKYAGTTVAVHEQGAFNEYLRYEYNKPGDWKILECDETDGFPGSYADCAGAFIAHYWPDKGRQKEGVSKTVLRPFMEQLRTSFLWNEDDLVVNEHTGNVG